MFDPAQRNISRFRIVLTTLCDSNQLSDEGADCALDQYKELLVSFQTSTLFSGFDIDRDRLDILFNTAIDIKKHKHLHCAVSRLLLLAHGTANIENGFSVNKEIFEDNQGLETLIARRRIKDRLKHIGGALNFHVNKKVLTGVRCARMRYEKDLK